MLENAAGDWALDLYRRANLPDVRLTARLVRLATVAARNPGGRILDVYKTSADRQGAYDFLENPRVSVDRIAECAFGASVRGTADFPYAFVVVDGASLTLTDRGGRKGFGSVGTSHRPATGLHLINAYAVEPDGTPIGVVGQVWWSRRASKRRQDHKLRDVSERETQRWLDTVAGVSTLFEEFAPKTRAWFVVDREGDSSSMLKSLDESGHFFTVRSNADRIIESSTGRSTLQRKLNRQRTRYCFDLQVAPGLNRTGRVARMAVRACSVTLRPQRPAQPRVRMELNCVEIREVGARPRGEKPLHWRLLTNVDIETHEGLRAIVRSYSCRWRIEELHRTWKSGACRIEDSQLRSVDALKKWATLMITVAARIERLKIRSRTEPAVLADVELTKYEIEALIILKRKYKKKTETIPDEMPTLAQAVLWLAEIGGYTGKSSGGPPGSITIRRGYDDIIQAAALLEALEKAGRLR